LKARDLEIALIGSTGVGCQDCIRADLRARFSIHLKREKEAVLKVAKAVGCAPANRSETPAALFAASLNKAFRIAARGHAFDWLAAHSEWLPTEVAVMIQKAGAGGYQIELCEIGHFGATPIDQLDRNHILDARGIAKQMANLAKQGRRLP
jgi:uncharacterized membrane protein YqiK